MKKMEKAASMTNEDILISPAATAVV